MAKVAPQGTLASDYLQIGGGGALRIGAMVKRKTPSELRGEQLKRTNIIDIVDESQAAFDGSIGNNGEGETGVKNHGVSKNPRYISTRLDEVYPAKKSRFQTVSRKENAKENSTSLRNLAELSNLAAKKKDQHLRSKNSLAEDDVFKVDATFARPTIERCSQSTFRSVTELSVGGEKTSSMADVDMDKALKGMVACEPALNKPVESSESSGDPSSTSNFCSEFHLPGHKAPLDLTLKTCIQLVSSSSMNWINRTIMYSGYNCVPQLSGFMENHIVGESSKNGPTSGVLGSKILHSWVYPQSILPPSLMSVLALSAANGVEMDFVRKRQLAWEESFRSLYYMLRKNACNIFYVCISQLVVMFTGGWGRAKHSFNAYISQSTQGLRTLLKEHDVCFTMPLCHSNVDQATTEDLVELSEIEKHNLGQTRRRRSFSDIDDTPQSLLAFNGNRSVHGLYDFLVNYRSLLTFLTAVDVPVLYSPVPFQNAALSTPEVKCMKMKRADRPSVSCKGPIDKSNSSSDGAPTSLCYSVEIKDAYLPPWIISGICAAMGSKDRSFEASFMTEHSSVSLNAALEPFCEKTDPQAPTEKNSQESSCAFGIFGVTVTPFLRSGFLKGLKYCDGSYAVSLAPV